MLLASLGIGFGVSGASESMEMWDKQKGFRQYIQQGFGAAFHEHIIGLRQALGRDNANAATSVEDWQSDVPAGPARG